MKVKPKKHLGQHFLKNPEICRRIASEIRFSGDTTNVLEIGPGTGALTQYLLKLESINLKLIDLDRESVEYLKSSELKLNEENILFGDFLKNNINSYFDSSFILVGNFPYNISSQILFKVFENKSLIPECLGMFQKEVAERVCSEPGNKNYGILSVLLQTFYTCEYLFTVSENEFIPPPKVESGVIRLIRKVNAPKNIDESKLKTVVKMAFNQRRKTLRNSLKALIKSSGIDTSDEVFTKRPEQLGWEDFVRLTHLLFP